MTDRLTVDTITSDQLDALQLQAARMEHAVQQYAELHVRLEDAEAGITAAIRQRKAAEERASKAERAEAAIARVRRLCELTITASVRVQAVAQARDTLTALDEPKEQ
ncbi:hypothetical protein ACQEVY_23370 [Streptomyces sp. CA-288835]|uniref:hypothetical protein n=1 Tax=Streptomyces sp. CA-288835 TaxID=3240069 RepID=UPI003D8CC081